MFVRTILFFVLILTIESQVTLSPEPINLDVCDEVTCVRKCCPLNQFINITSCAVPEDGELSWNPTFHKESKLLDTLTSPPKDLQYVHGFLSGCESFLLMPSQSKDDEFYLLQDGKLKVPLYGKSYDVSQYCIDKLALSLDELVDAALLCFETPVEKPSRACIVVKEYVYPLLLLVSCVFLVITLFVYVCIPELRGKLHGRCLLSMISSLLAAYVIMTIVYLGSEDMNDAGCLTTALLKQVSLLASFFWLNIMCFDIWRSLSSMRPASETSAKSRQRFLLYSLYAWGCPITIGIISMVIEKLPESYGNVIRPNFLNVLGSCWFEGTKAIWYHFYMVISILVAANIIFFGLVAYILVKSQTNSQLQRARSQNRDRMWLYGRLFLVMGITWITEVISWSQGTCEAWIFTDVINALQGFTIFLVFVCKKTTRQLVNRRFSKMKTSMGSSIGKKSGSRSSTFFTSLSKSSTNNTNSSALSYSAESQSLTAGSPQNDPPQGIQPNTRQSLMAAINEVNDILENEAKVVEIDEDCPSIADENEDVNKQDLEKTNRYGTRENELNPTELKPSPKDVIECETEPIINGSVDRLASNDELNESRSSLSESTSSLSSTSLHEELSVSNKIPPT